MTHWNTCQCGKRTRHPNGLKCGTCITRSGNDVRPNGPRVPSKPVCWNYCASCHTERTRNPNGSQCRKCLKRDWYGRRREHALAYNQEYYSR